MKRHTRAAGATTLYLVLGLFVASALALTYWLTWRSGGQHAELKATVSQAQATALASQAEVRRVDNALQANQKIGAQVEVRRQAIDQHYEKLNREAKQNPPSAVDRCELPTDRLRQWRSANAGPNGADQGAAATEPDSASAAAAPAS